MSHWIRCRCKKKSKTHLGFRIKRSLGSPHVYLGSSRALLLSLHVPGIGTSQSLINTAMETDIYNLIQFRWASNTFPASCMSPHPSGAATEVRQQQHAEETDSAACQPCKFITEQSITMSLAVHFLATSSSAWSS